MLVGVVGKTNTGKTTFFSAATRVDAKIAPFPFTTIEPNIGKAYVRSKCPEVELRVKCNPHNSLCENGTRLIPIDVIDVAGLVPDAHLGKGLGLRFLDDLRAADVLIQVVDVSGTTDAEGKQCEFYDPANEIKFLEEEIAYWISGIIKRSWSKIKGSDADALAGLLSGLKVTKEHVEKTLTKTYIAGEKINWSDDDILNFSRELRRISKPILIAANKIDLPNAHSNYLKLKEKFPEKIILPCSAESELALRKASEMNVIKYVPGDKDFQILKNDIPEKQMNALKFIGEKILLTYKGTGVQEIINKAVFEQLKLIVVYPVEDENKFSNHFGKVLPDAILMENGSTNLDLATKVHTDLAKNFVCAIDARTKRRLGKEYVLKDGDVLKIVANVRG
jgi:hypothetical protein